MIFKRYRSEIDKAGARVESIGSRTIQTSFGEVEFATAGAGQPVLMSHGIMGGHDAGIGMVPAYCGDALAIAPSRFGYFRSKMPAGATPALQADAYREILDELEVSRAVVVGFSAGGPSAIEFALRHPDRVELLVLASSALPREPIPGMVRRIAPHLMRVALSSDFPFWAFKTLLPGTFRHLLGVPKGFETSAQEAETLRRVGDSVFPIRPRRDGAVFDAFIGNPYVNTCPLEAITTPTLIVHAADDSLAPYETARNAALRIPAARFITVGSGGHEFLGQEVLVREAIATYLTELRVELTVSI